MQRMPSAVDAVARLQESGRSIVGRGERWRIVERAVGLFAGRMGCSLTEAQTQLTQLARDEAQDLADVAATVLRLLDAGPHGQTPDRSSLLRAVRHDVDAGSGHWEPVGAGADPQVAFGWLDARQADDLAAAISVELGGTLGAVDTLVVAVERDGGAEVIGSAGVAVDTLRRWQRIPAGIDTPAGAVARSGQPAWLPEFALARRRYALIGGPHWPSRAWLPVLERGRAIGVVGVLCRESCPFEPAARRAVRAAIATHSEPLRRLLTAPSSPAVPSRWRTAMQAVIEILPVPAALTSPVRDASGAVVDFRIDAISPDMIDVVGRRGPALLGLRMLEAFPGLIDTGLWDATRETLATGQPGLVELDRYQQTSEGVHGEISATVRFTRFGDALLVTWAPRDAGTGPLERLAQFEQVGNQGWYEWDLTTDRIEWSPQVYRIFERDPAAGPMSSDEIASLVAPDDAPARSLAVTKMLEHGRPMDVTFRLHIGERIKYLRAVGAATRDATGRPTKMYGLLQDITTLERNRAQLAELQRHMVHERVAKQTEDRLVAQLRRTVPTPPDATLDLTGLSVAARYHRAGQPGRGGGDWYHATNLPDGRVLLAVGGVAGHGVRAASDMAHLYRAVTAMTRATVGPGSLLSGLNRMLYESDGNTATAVVACYEPASAKLTYAQAGHPVPLLAQDGKVRQLPRPAGMLLGADRDARYAETTVTVYPGDVLLMYTDGLLSDLRRGRGDRKAVRRVLRVARAAGQPLDEVLGALPPTDPHGDACVLLARPAPRAPAPGVPADATQLLALDVDHDRLEAVRVAVLDSAATNGLTDLGLYMFTLAVMEIATNAVEHGGARGRLRIWRHSDHLLVEVVDEGNGIPAARRPAGRPAPEQEGGRGLWLAHEICESVDFDTGPTGTTVRLRYRVDR
jgi:anti-sigma regulatory factor (Ser/Thr protein kinase)/PAS domain-containing protein